MALAFAGGPELWPLTSCGGLFRHGFGKVAKKLAARTDAGAGREYPTLADAVRGVVADGHSLGRDDVTFVASTRGDEWTAVFESTYPRSEATGYLFARARLDVKCDYAAYSWIPASARSVPAVDAVLPAAQFLDYRHASRWRQRAAPDGDARTVEAIDEGGSWMFNTIGPEREYERPETYGARRRADRLPLELIEHYLESVGIPVADPHWLAGPVLALVEPRGNNHADWTSTAELRAVCGYPDTGIPARLVGWDRA